MSLQDLLDRQLAIAGRQDPHHCSVCGKHLGMWYYGFPFPYCAACWDNIRLRPVSQRCPFRRRPCQREECQP